MCNVLKDADFDFQAALDAFPLTAETSTKRVWWVPRKNWVPRLKITFTLVVHSFTFHSVSCIDNKTKFQ